MKKIFITKSFLNLRTVFFLLLSLLFVFFDNRGQSLQFVRTILSEGVSPIYYIVNVPINFVDWVISDFSARKKLVKQNKVLKNKLLVLKARIKRFNQLQRENNELRSLLLSSKGIVDHFLVAKLIGNNIDPFINQIRLNRGTHDSVFVGQPVLDADGVVGQVIQVSQFFSTVLLLSDVKNAVPVTDKRSGIRAIATGTGSQGQLKLMHVAKSSDVRVGDYFFTSGLAGRYPQGYPVGVVTSVKRKSGDHFALITLKPNAHLGRGRLLLLVWPNTS